MAKLRVMVVDDHRLLREAMRGVLNTDPGIEVVAEARNGQEALERAAEVKPDVVCMDVHMPVLDGIEATRRLLAAHPGVRVIALSACAEEHVVQEMLNAGAERFIVKINAPTQLMQAIRGE